MSENFETKIEFKDRAIKLYKENKLKIYLLLIILIISLITLYFFDLYKKKNNNLVSEKYIQAGLLLSAKQNKKALNIYDEIILSKNEFYSILSLNTIIENDLTNDQDKIIKYFEIIEKTVGEEEQKDLIILKKGLYLLSKSKKEEGNSYLKVLIDKDSKLKKLAKESLAQ